MNVLHAENSGQIDASRTWVVTGRERHVADAREGCLPYPHRALRTKEFLYIRNFAPDRWPMGSPKFTSQSDMPSVAALERNTFVAFADMDASPTKAWLVHQFGGEDWEWQYNYAFGKRPAEELYDLRKDPDEILNCADDPAYAAHKRELGTRLLKILTDAKDPRVIADPVPFEHPPFAGPVRGDHAAAKDQSHEQCVTGSNYHAAGTAGHTVCRRAIRPACKLRYHPDPGRRSRLRRGFCHGNPVLKTPNLGRLHDEGVRCCDLHVSPTCSPTRCALMTGQHEFKSGVTHTIMEPERISLKATAGPVLRWSGYATGILASGISATKRTIGPTARLRRDVHPRGGRHGHHFLELRRSAGNTYFDPAILTTARSRRQMAVARTSFSAGDAVDGVGEGAAAVLLLPCHRSPREPLQVRPETAATPASAAELGQVLRHAGPCRQQCGPIIGPTDTWGIQRQTPSSS